MYNWDDLSVREQTIIEISDLYKDVHGIRPRHFNFKSMTDEQVFAVYDDLCKTLLDDMNREADELERSIQRALDAGAPDRETALCWLS